MLIANSNGGLQSHRIEVRWQRRSTAPISERVALMIETFTIPFTPQPGATPAEAVADVLSPRSTDGLFERSAWRLWLMELVSGREAEFSARRVRPRRRSCSCWGRFERSSHTAEVGGRACGVVRVQVTK